MFWRERESEREGENKSRYGGTDKRMEVRRVGRGEGQREGGTESQREIRRRWRHTSGVTVKYEGSVAILSSTLGPRMTVLSLHE